MVDGDIKIEIVVCVWFDIFIYFFLFSLKYLFVFTCIDYFIKIDFGFLDGKNVEKIFRFYRDYYCFVYGWDFGFLM